MIPESEHLRYEIVLRELRLPEKTTSTRKALVRWLALSLGLISPGESRLILFDVLDALFYYYFNDEKPTSKDIISFVKKQEHNKDISEKSVLYHLTRLKEQGLLISKDRHYIFNIPPDVPKGSSLGEGIRQLYLKRCDSTLSKIEKVIDKIEMMY